MPNLKYLQINCVPSNCVPNNDEQKMSYYPVIAAFQKIILSDSDTTEQRQTPLSRQLYTNVPVLWPAVSLMQCVSVRFNVRKLSSRQ